MTELKKLHVHWAQSSIFSVFLLCMTLECAYLGVMNAIKKVTLASGNKQTRQNKTTAASWQLVHRKSPWINTFSSPSYNVCFISSCMLHFSCFPMRNNPLIFWICTVEIFVQCGQWVPRLRVMKYTSPTVVTRKNRHKHVRPLFVLCALMHRWASWFKMRLGNKKLDTTNKTSFGAIGWSYFSVLLMSANYSLSWSLWFETRNGARWFDLMWLRVVRKQASRMGLYSFVEILFVDI